MTNIVKNSELKARETLKKLLSDRRWRIDNLYRIVNKNGDDIPFSMNTTQKLLYLSLWYNNAVLKSRQHGITTFAQIYGLDLSLFVPNLSSVIIAHNREDAEDFFHRNIKFAYENLDKNLKNEIKIVKETASHLRFSNGSSIRVTTSGRSGTFQFCHISELGKICAKYPDKAREIKTGTLNTVHPGSIVIIESTAEGREGLFYDICNEAEKKKISGAKLSKLDYRFHFFGWHQDKQNQLSTDGVVIKNYQNDYFDQLRIKNNIVLSPEQKAWYVKKWDIQGEDMKREHPSTSEEAFESSIEGTYYHTQFLKIREDKRICSVPYQDSITVDTWWDLGMNDEMSIWFTQNIGREIHVIDFYSNSGEGLKHYADILDKKKYRYGRHTAPHDIKVRELGTGVSRLRAARDMGIKFDVAKNTSVLAGIEMVRQILSICWFDEENTSKGIVALESYRKEWNDKLGCYRNNPLHDFASHPSDAFRTLAVAHNFISPVDNFTKKTKIPSTKGWT